jgi:hypothetical protein
MNIDRMIEYLSYHISFKYLNSPKAQFSESLFKTITKHQYENKFSNIANVIIDIFLSK